MYCNLCTFYKKKKTEYKLTFNEINKIPSLLCLNDASKIFSRSPFEKYYERTHYMYKVSNKGLTHFKRE